MQYFEDEAGVARVVQRGSREGEPTGYYVAIERRETDDGDWFETEVLGEKRRASQVGGNRSKPESLE